MEAAYSRTFIISSKCPNGPTEIIGDDQCGLLYRVNDNLNFQKKFDLFMKMDKSEILLKKKNALKKAKLFSIFSHAKSFNKLLII